MPMRTGLLWKGCAGPKVPPSNAEQPRPNSQVYHETAANFHALMRTFRGNCARPFCAKDALKNLLILSGITNRPKILGLASFSAHLSGLGLYLPIRAQVTEA